MNVQVRRKLEGAQLNRISAVLCIWIGVVPIFTWALFGNGWHFFLLMTLPVLLVAINKGDAWERLVFLLAASGTAAFLLYYLPLIVHPKYNDWIGQSDDWLYDRVAWEAAKNLPLISQLNPMHLGGVEYVAKSLGYNIAYAGYFKFLSVLYSVSAWMGEPHVLSGLAVNVLAVGIIAKLSFRVCTGVGGNGKWAVWGTLIFVLNPVLLESAASLRKDVVVTLLLMAAVFAIIQRRIILLAVSVGALLVFRLPVAVLIGCGVGATWLLLNAKVGSVRKVVFVGFVVLCWVALAGAFFHFFGSQFFDVRDAALERLRDVNGASALLLNSSFGKVLFALLYPFPALDVNSYGSLLDFYKSGYEVMFYGGLVYVAFLLRRMLGSRSFDHVFVAVLFCGFFIIMIVLVQFAVSKEVLFVLEPRYKLPFFCWLVLFWGSVVAAGGG